MRALVYDGPGPNSWDTVPDPTIEEATDVIVSVDATTVCGATCASCGATSPG